MLLKSHNPKLSLTAGSHGDMFVQAITPMRTPGTSSDIKPQEDQSNVVECSHTSSSPPKAKYIHPEPAFLQSAASHMLKIKSI